MRLLYTSDIHASPDHIFSMFSIAEAESVNGIIVGGDLIPHSLPGEQQKGILKAQADYLQDILVPEMKRFRNKNPIPVYLDMANDDFIWNRSILERYNCHLFYLLHMSKHPLTEHIDIIGYMGVPPTPFTRKDWEKPDALEYPFSKGNEIQLSGVVSSSGTLKKTALDMNANDTIEKDLCRLSEIIEKPFIFVSHTPPYHTDLDVIYNGLNVGSLSVRHFIEKWAAQGKLVGSLHGHIHESPGRSGMIHTVINGVVCINPGQGNGRGSPFGYVIIQLKDSGIEILKAGGTPDNFIKPV